MVKRGEKRGEEEGVRPWYGSCRSVAGGKGEGVEEVLRLRFLTVSRAETIKEAAREWEGMILFFYKWKQDNKLSCPAHR